MTASLDNLLQDRLRVARLLAIRLERLSADSHWAHQASGLRGALLRSLETLECQSALPQPDPTEVQRQLPGLELLIERGFIVLYRAARLIRTPDTGYYDLYRTK